MNTYKSISPSSPRMLQKVFAVTVKGKSDMAQLESVVVGLLGGEHHRCSFLRSGEYQRFRNAALYTTTVSDDTISVHFEGLKLVLTPNHLACVYITDPVVVPVPAPPSTSSGIAEEEEYYACASLVGKKRRAVTPDSDEEPLSPS